MQVCGEIIFDSLVFFSLLWSLAASFIFMEGPITHFAHQSDKISRHQALELRKVKLPALPTYSGSISRDQLAAHTPPPGCKQSPRVTTLSRCISGGNQFALTADDEYCAAMAAPRAPKRHRPNLCTALKMVINNSP
jgi:hypothetical protein